MDSIHEVLERHWGYTQFRPLQEEIINSVLAGNDTIGLMPTGGGKSLTFQVPAMMLDGLTIVITPLISLMKDQVDGLRRRGIKAAYFHAGMTSYEARLTWERLFNGGVKLLYISPERLASEYFVAELKRLHVKLIVVDEAHCISQWGYDFRPAYLNIGRLRVALPSLPVLALTATATNVVESDIAAKLLMKGEKRFRKSFQRNNISYLVRYSEDKNGKLVEILRSTVGSAIVYVRSRRRTREIASFLSDCGISAGFYHAGMKPDEKEEQQDLWQAGKIRVMVATNAFGMGIDKADVRVVVHHDIPSSLEEYYQEAGRAGRDGMPAFAVLLAAKKDKSTLKKRVTEAFPAKEDIRKIYERICNFLGIAVGDGCGRLYEFDEAAFCNTFNIQSSKCKASMRILGGSGYLEYLDESESRSRIMIVRTRQELYEDEFSEDEERVMRCLMSLYAGLFTEYIDIDEHRIARETGIDPLQVYPMLVELQRRHVVSYIPRRRTPYIYMTMRRVEVRYIEISREVYENRRVEMEKRIDAMLDYAFDGSSCRVQRMLRYFGEGDACECGSCDYCRSQRSKNGCRNLEAEVERFVVESERGVSASDLRRKFGTAWRDAWKHIVALENEGAVRLTDDNLIEATKRLKKTVISGQA